MVLTLLHAVVLARTISQFSPDSWSYYELSKSVFTDFMRAATVRQFQIDTPYSSSFPPLLPVLMALWNAVFHAGIYASTFINAIAAAISYPVLVTLGRRLSRSEVPGMLAAVALLGNPWYLEEVMAGRAIPIAILLMLVLLHLFARIAVAPSGNAGLAAVAGLVAGLAFEVRFDFLLTAIVLGAALATLHWVRFRTSGSGLVAVAYYAGLAVGLAPWITYSLAHFHVPLVSDHGRTVIMVDSPFVLQFIPFPQQMQTLWTNPVAWVFAKVAAAERTLTAMATALAASPALVLIAAYAALRWAVPTGGQWGIKDQNASPPSSAESAGAVLGLAWLVVLIQTALVSLTGYPDLRYWIGMSLVATLSGAVGIVNGLGAIAGEETDAIARQTFIASSPFLLLPAELGLLAQIAHRADSVTGLFSFFWPAMVLLFFACGSLVHSGRIAGIVAMGSRLSVVLAAGAIAVGALTASHSRRAHYSLLSDGTAATAPATARLVDGLDGFDPAAARVLVAAVAGAPLICEFGARTGIGNILKPTPPFGWVDLLLLVRRYHITHAIAGDQELDARLPVLFEVHRSKNGAMWRIDGERAGMVVVDPLKPVVSILGEIDVVSNTLGPVHAMRREISQDAAYPLVFVPRR